jgi:membrane protease YdiL (CAAX protease family)
MDRTDQRDVAEVALVVAAIGAFLWFGRKAFPGVDVAFAATLLAILAYSHWRAGEGWREIGFRGDTFWPTMRMLLPVVFVGCVAIWSAAIVLRELGSAAPDRALSMTPMFVVFGIAQQYVMLGFIFKRVQRVAGARFAPAPTALIFALLHLPNVFLTAVTFVWGVVACLVYRRSPNIWANGLVHSLMATLLYYQLPHSVTHGLRVGIEYVYCCTVR